MLLFAIFTLGYFAGVFTALLVFPPRTTELEEQEIDALKPILEAEGKKEAEHKAIEEGIYEHPVLTTNY